MFAFIILSLTTFLVFTLVVSSVIVFVRTAKYGAFGIFASVISSAIFKLLEPDWFNFVQYAASSFLLDSGEKTSPPQPASELSNGTIILIVFLILILYFGFQKWIDIIHTDKNSESDDGSHSSIAKQLHHWLRRISSPIKEEIVVPSAKDTLFPILATKPSDFAWEELARKLFSEIDPTPDERQIGEWNKNFKYWPFKDHATGKISLLLYCPLRFNVDDFELFKEHVEGLKNDNENNIKIWAYFLEQHNSKDSIENPYYSGLFDRIEYLDEIVSSRLGVGEYEDYLAERVGRAARESGKSFERDVHVDLNVVDYSFESALATKKDRVRSLQNALNEWIKSANERQILCIFGEYGQGKTRSIEIFAQKELDRFRKSDVKADVKFPLYINLAGANPSRWLNSRSSLLDSLISNLSTELRMAALRALVRRGGVVFIFDAFDEMESGFDRYTIRRHFEALMQLVRSGDFNNNAIFCGRASIFDGDMARSVFQLDEEPGGASALSLCLMTNDQIKSATRWMEEDDQYKEARNLLIQSLSNETYKDLLSRPMLLQLYAVLAVRGEIGTDEDNTNEELVIERFIASTLLRDYDNKDDLSEEINIDPLNVSRLQIIVWTSVEERLFFTIAFSLESLKNHSANSLSANLFSSMVSKYLNDWKSDGFYLNRNLASEIARSDRPLPDRRPFVDQEERNKEIINELRGRSIFETLDDEGVVVRLVHSAFCDYLVSAFFISRIFGECPSIITRIGNSESINWELWSNELIKKSGVSLGDLAKNPTALAFFTKQMFNKFMKGGNDIDRKFVSKSLKRILSVKAGNIFNFLPTSIIIKGWVGFKLSKLQYQEIGFLKFLLSKTPFVDDVELYIVQSESRTDITSVGIRDTLFWSMTKIFLFTLIFIAFFITWDLDLSTLGWTLSAVIVWIITSLIVGRFKKYLDKYYSKRHDEIQIWYDAISAHGGNTRIKFSNILKLSEEDMVVMSGKDGG